MSVHFKAVRYRNFLSTGAQFTEIKLDRSPTTLIVGENGAGKSTILDAICYVLFNKPFRNINKPQLVNSINQKQMVVEIDFNVGPKQYKIVRGAKPTVFEIYLNGDLVNQVADSRDYQQYLEEHVLKLNYKSFTQIVILGSASFTPFMQLPAGHRREIIEDLLDIKIFSYMNDVLKEKHNENKNNITLLENNIQLGKSKAKLQQGYIETLENDKLEKVNLLTAEIEKCNEKIQVLIDTRDKQQSIIDNLKNSITDLDANTSKESKLKAILDKLKLKKKDSIKEINFYKDNDTCPTCSQTLDEEFKVQAVHSHEEKLNELAAAIEQIENQILDVESRLEQINEIKNEIIANQNLINKTSSDIITEQSLIGRMNKEIEQCRTNTGNIDDEKLKLKEIAKEVVKLNEEKAAAAEERQYLNMAEILLKDTGIKTKIIKQYLPLINKLVNKFLQSMDFFVSFELNESFNETIKSRHRDEFSYASFSEGEKAKIDLALLFTWRTIARMKNSTNTNLLLLDEVFDGSLDLNGTDYVMNILNTIGEESNIFVISHKDALFDKFRSVIRFVKKNNFSTIA